MADCLFQLRSTANEDLEVELAEILFENVLKGYGVVQFAKLGDGYWW